MEMNNRGNINWNKIRNTVWKSTFKMLITLSRFIIAKPEIFIVIAILAFQLKMKLWEKPGRVIFLDVYSYYGYLPASFIAKDVTLKNRLPIRGTFLYKVPDGQRSIFKMTCGLSLLYSPFFIATHWILSGQHIQHTGYEAIFKIALLVSAVFWLWIGLFYLRKTINRFFNRGITTITLLILFVGTNLGYYSVVEATMSHQYSFALFAIFIWVVIKWYEGPTIMLSIIAGLVFGAISLIRPTNSIIILFPLLYGINNFNDLNDRIMFLRKKSVFVLIIIGGIVLVWIPQMLYWHNITGHWLYWSYQGEHFHFYSPKITAGLFSFRKGWLLYTPCILFAIIGIFRLKKRLSSFFYPTLLFLLLNTYIVFSWWCWWYGACFGQRAMVESYTLLAIPMAAVIEYLYKAGNLKNRILSVLFILSVLLGGFHTLKYYHGSIHNDSMTREAYFKYFFSLKPSGSFLRYLDTPDYYNK